MRVLSLFTKLGTKDDASGNTSLFTKISPEYNASGNMCAVLDIMLVVIGAAVVALWP
ncbi:hypothetical protein PF005_g10456 [Phytophthora fragariae]|uniref:Uncharacterized protein n=1 Tax=Phytophthora fragariae TaxID=53985 RepID=A0A6A3Y623_9STRA|nr:hypothetical protein PF003_g15072 [Phytophthora fragariae]KAE8929271.1 hypothetical protein PF009_g20611 [Phytophthora fragariae]KAE9008105.1 hypothetical protein PF011_g10831 [Phytophthora fragariae]KAE9091708.1 hypothetical protein PF010_g18087 [Phytophthora fragariae]KAE9120056.1 hypothetical protein PF006_g18220 [Phytophthora fragariae]